MSTPPSASGEPARQGETEARALHLRLQWALDLPELLEDVVVLLRGDADAGVRDGERHVAIVERRGDLHDATLGELQRVRDEIAQDLRQLAAIRLERDVFVRLIEQQRNVLGRGDERPQHAAQSAHEIGNGESFRPQDRLAGICAGEIQHVVDERGELFGRGAHEADLLALLFGELAVRAVEQNARQPEDRVQRCAEFMADVRDHAALHRGGASRDFRAVFQLEVQGAHAAVRFFELAQRLLELVLLPLDLARLPEDLPVQLYDLGERLLHLSQGAPVFDRRFATEHEHTALAIRLAAERPRLDAPIACERDFDFLRLGFPCALEERCAGALASRRAELDEQLAGVGSGALPARAGLPR